MKAAISRGFIGIDLAEEVLAEIDRRAVTATAFVGEHAAVLFAVDVDAGHAAAEGVFVGAGGVVRVVAEHDCGDLLALMCNTRPKKRNIP